MIAVGAVWAGNFGGPKNFVGGAIDYTTTADQIASFSQRDPNLLDIFAPGILITGANANGGTTTLGGTSQATAYITGVATLAQQIAQEKLGRKLTVSEFRNLLDTNSVIINDGDNENDNVTNTGENYPRVDLLKLAAGILSLSGTSPNPDPVNPGNNNNNNGTTTSDNTINQVHTINLTAGEVRTGIDFGNQQITGNQAPTVANPIADQSVNEDTNFTFVIPANTFVDADAGNVLTYTTTLPSWLTFAAATRTISGTPTNSDVGTINIKVTATDNAGASIDDTFTLTVTNTNDAPTLGSAIANQTATEDTLFTFQIPANTFSDIDAGDTLTYSATAPSWLTFNATTRTFSGTPGNSDVGAVNITVTATDSAGASVDDTFTLTVANTNDAPILGNAIANQTATEDTPFTLQIPANTFSDIDVGDTLTYSATTPSWLTFNASTPTNSDVGSVNITLTATDSSGASVDDIFTLTVANTNDAPTLGQAIADQTATISNSFNFTIPQNTFSDVDAGDTLTYSATLENGDPLPSWLSFNTNTRTFSGTPVTSNAGIVNIKITASDTQGATASDIFALRVTASNVIPGNDTNNSLSGTPGADIINGFGGDDYIEGLAGNDTIDGGTGRFDRMFGGDGDDTITDPDGILGAHGGLGNDTINVTFAANWDNDNNPNTAPRSDGKITGGYGDDNITVTMNNSKFFINLKGDEPINNPQGGNDVITLLGSYQNATVDLGSGNDTFIGGNGDDDVSGGAGNDTIFGLGGNDKLTGNNGDDILVGGVGKDTLTGGTGKDIFSFSSPIGHGIDTITDFNSTDDKIRVDAAGFGGGLVTGTLFETQFVLGTVAKDESDRFIYNQSTGALFFDVDGTGSSLKVQIATLSTKPVIDSTNIVVI
ncbi:putative Ig domain-containing protein [Nostoc sp. TCL26-01]|uniref:putative Ig domain-containing protein n=1 Tax=Nostoc sp. TCL26-01 TaxID=2576904 RepID=UPI0021198A95|nr:putative Ig domain-containing protein [Nostoc sp. TCL26-01]